MRLQVVVRLVLVGLVIALITTPGAVPAQSTFATSTGVVADQSGAVVRPRFVRCASRILRAHTRGVQVNHG